MHVSFNEVESLSKRAARGAGLSWGIAEEAAKAVRWLAAHGIDGIGIFANVLNAHQDGRVAASVLTFVGNQWHAPSGAICPLHLGSMLCDHAQAIAAGQKFAFAEVFEPLLIAPYAATAAKLSNCNLHLRFDDFDLWFDGESAFANFAPATVISSATDGLCAATDHREGTLLSPIADCSVDQTAWAILSEFSHRTYAPATEASRLVGAGAGTDNDE